ncbi:gliding motility protein GldL [Prolixibacteraceae bacterium JC049]|nr:gliding motility protein GldL [Prolixibacteraceae bacterium JC049]
MNITEIMQSKRWKTFMGFVYGWGAAVVMLGALFKLQHWPYSGPMLTVGLVTEAFIFFLSAFEPPTELPEWGKVYPELREDYDSLMDDEFELSNNETKIGDILKNTEITPELLSKVSKGLTDLSNTASSLTDISTATLATDIYVKNLNAASESVNTFAELNNHANQTLNSSVDQLVQSYSNSAQNFTQTSDELNTRMQSSGAKLASELEKTGDKLSSAYNEMASNIDNNVKSFDSNSKSFQSELSQLNQHITALNKAYQTQLKSSEDQGKVNEQYVTDLKELHTALAASLQQMKQYQEHSQQLNQNIEALNNIYGNMLGAMNYKK